MALQWMILTYVVAAEALIALILTLPTPKLVKSRLVSLISLALQPALFIVPFAAFQLLDIYWKSEHRVSCSSDVCTAAERDRSEKSVTISGTLSSCVSPKMAKSAILSSRLKRNMILCVSACFLYWSIFRICKYYKDIHSLEEAEKKFKDE